MSKEESCTGGLLQLAVPLILSNLAYTLLGTLDTIFMGRVGIIELGAVGVASALFLAVGVFLRGTVGAVMVVVAHSLGAGDKKRARRAFQHAIVLALLLSPLSLLVPKLFRVLFALVKPDKNVRSLALTYVAIRSWELPLGLVSKAISGFMLGAGDSRVPMFVSWVTVGVNMAANYVLVFGKLGFPALGLAGAAWGTVISHLVQTILYAAFVFGLYDQIFQLTRDFHFPNGREIKAMLRLGVPMGMAVSTDLTAFGIFMTLIARLGTVELAASQVASQLNDLAFMPAFAIGSATSSLVGRSLGEQNPRRAKEYGLAGLRVGMVMMGLLAAGYALCPQVFVLPFTKDVQVRALSCRLLKMVALYQVLDVIHLVFAGVLNGAGRTRFTGGVTLVCASIVFIPAAYLGAFVLGLGVWGAWAGPIIYVLCLVIIFGLCFRRGSWQAGWAPG